MTQKLRRLLPDAHTHTLKPDHQYLQSNESTSLRDRRIGSLGSSLSLSHILLFIPLRSLQQAE